MSFRLGWLILCSAAWVFGAELVSVRFREARQLVAAGKLDEAIAEYRAILLDEPDNAQAYFEAGLVRARQQKWNAAIQNFQLALQRQPNMWDAAVQMAEAYERLGQKEKAVAEWRRIADKGPDSLRARASARIPALLGALPEFGSAVLVSSAVPRSSSSSVPALSLASKNSQETPEFMKGLEAYEAGKWSESLQWWRKVLAANPGHAGAYYYAGVCRYNLGELDKAVYNFRKSFSYPEKGHNAHYYLGRIAERRRDTATALEHYERYLKLTSNPEGRSEAQKRVRALRAGRFRGASDSAAIEENKTATAVEAVDGPPSRVLTFRKGLILAYGNLDGPGALEVSTAIEAIKTGNFNQAIEGLKQVRLQYPETRNALAADYNLAVLYCYMGLVANARSLLTALLEKEPAEPWRSAMRYLLAEMLMADGESEAAQRLADSVRADQELGPSASAKVELLSRISQARKNEKEIPAMLENSIAAESDPGRQAALRFKLGKAYEKQGLLTEAIRAYEALREKCSPLIGEPCREGLLSLAEIHYKAQAWQQSLEIYKQVVSDYPDPEDSPWGMYQIGNIYRRQGQWSEAVRAYEALMRKYPDSYWAEQAKWNKEDVLWRAEHAKVLRVN